MNPLPAIRRALAATCPCGDHHGVLHPVRCTCATCRMARTSYQLNGLRK